MPIFNASVTGEGGGQGGGDKVTALVGSNASGIDVGDKVVLNTDPTKDLVTEYRFQEQVYNSGQWVIFFGEYMMYVNTSGKPVFLKHDTVSDKLIYIKTVSSITIDTVGGYGSTTATRITYNENTKRFAVCKNGILKIYQVDVNDSDASVSLLWSTGSFYGNGGIAQDTDTMWYIGANGDLDSIILQDFSCSNDVFTPGIIYTHTNTCPAFSGTTYYNIGFNPNLTRFVLSADSTESSSSMSLCGISINKENKQVTYADSLTASDAFSQSSVPSTTAFYLNNDGVGVLVHIVNQYYQSAVFSVGNSGSVTNFTMQAAYAMPYNEPNAEFGYSCNIAGVWYGVGVIHQTGNWVTGPYFAMNISSGSYVRTTYSSIRPSATGAGTCQGSNIAALSTTGIFIWPYGCNYSSVSIDFRQILTKWDNGAPVRGNTYITPDSSIGYPLYFDGSYLYASGGVYAVSGGALTRIGNVTTSGLTQARLSCFPPVLLQDGTVMFGASSGGTTVPILSLNNGIASGQLTDSSSSVYYYLTDTRFDSSKTGFAVTSPTSTSNGYSSLYYFSNGSQVAYISGTTGGYWFTFFDSSNDAYCVKLNDGQIVKCTYSNGSITRGSTLFTSSALYSLIGTGSGYLACASSRVDNFQLWYRAQYGILGFVNMDIANSSVTILSMPDAMQYIDGTIYCAWWDLQNRLNIRTSTGLYVFSYSNHDISTLQLVKSFTWVADYSGPATCSPDLKSYAVGNTSYIKVVTQTAMPIYEFSANVYNGHNFGNTSLTGFVNEAPTTDPYGQPIVEVNTVKDPADTWTNVGTPFGFPVSTTSANVSVGAGYYNSGSAEIIMPSTVTKTLSQASSGQTTGYKNDVVVYHDTSDNNSALICKTGTTPVGTFKASTALTTPVYLSDTKSAIAGTLADSGLDVSYETETQQETDYTVTGSPTISSAGVLSGLTTSDYVTLDPYYLVNPNTFEFNTALSITSAPVADQTYLIISGNTTDSHYYAMSGIQLNIKNNQLAMGLYYGSTSVITYGIRGSTVLSLNTKYYIRIVFNGTKYTLQISTDGINYTDEVSYTSSTKVYQTAGLLIGGARSYNYPLNGEIYLADTNLTVNGSLVWKAFTPATDGSVTVSDGYKYLNEVDPPFYLGSDLTQSASQMVVHSEDFVDTPDQQKQGTLFLTKPTATSTSSVVVANTAAAGPVPNCTIVGSPSIDSNYVASGFSDNNYLRLPNFFDRAYESFELVTAVKMTEAATGEQGIFDTKGSFPRGIRLMTSSTNTVRLRVSTNGDNYSIDITGSTPLTVGTKVYIKATYSSSTGYALYTSTDGSTWTTEGTSSTTTMPKSHSIPLTIGDNYAAGLSLTGCIYLDDTYIKINDSTVWTATSNGDNNFAVVGSPIISDGVASVTRGSSGIIPSRQLRLAGVSTDTWEIDTSFLVSASNGYGYVVGAWAYYEYTAGVILSVGYNGLTLYLNDSGHGITTRSGSTAISTNTRYYVKVLFDGSDYKVKLSTDGTTYVDDIVISAQGLSRYVSSLESIMCFGYEYSRESPPSGFTGNIYLENTKMYKNGQLIWSAIPEPPHPIDTSKEYCGSVVDPINKGKVVTMDTTLTKILSVEDSA